MSSSIESISNYFTRTVFSFATRSFLKSANHLCFAFKTYTSCFLLLLLTVSKANSQVLTLKDAVQTAQNNYGTINAKANYLKASQASAKEASLEYLPNLNLAAQQAYGTANGQFGPMIASGGLNAASSGPAFTSQNWN